MKIQKINNQQNQNFKTKINAPVEFWKGLENTHNTTMVQRDLARIKNKSGARKEVIYISQETSPKNPKGEGSLPVVYTAKLPSGEKIQKTSPGNWEWFLLKIADRYVPMKRLSALIAEIKAS